MHAIGTEGALAVRPLETLVRFVVIASTIPNSSRSDLGHCSWPTRGYRPWRIRVTTSLERARVGTSRRPRRPNERLPYILSSK